MLSAATVTCALLGAAGLTASSTASAASIPQPGNGAALRMSLREDISQYLATRGSAEHISAVSLWVTFPGRAPGIDLAVGTAAGHPYPPASCGRSAATPKPSPR
jgi:hypothetical protein